MDIVAAFANAAAVGLNKIKRRVAALAVFAALPPRAKNKNRARPRALGGGNNGVNSQRGGLQLFLARFQIAHELVEKTVQSEFGNTDRAGLVVQIGNAAVFYLLELAVAKIQLPLRFAAVNVAAASSSGSSKMLMSPVETLTKVIRACTRRTSRKYLLMLSCGQ